MAPADIALRKTPFERVSSAELAQQLDGRQRCRRKLPLWYRTPGIYYPEKLAVEQASSQVAATYKAGLIPQRANIADLTGGFGVDTFFFAERATRVVHCEKNAALAEIALYNASVLGAANIDFVTADGLGYLRGQPDDAFDCVYIDPSRRVESRKVFRLEDCEPNVVENHGLLQQKAAKILIKTAPLLDITAALQALEQVSEVHIVSIENECKELLFILERECTAVPKVTAAALEEDRVHTFSFTPAEEKAATVNFGQPKHYLYEPDAALLKSGAFKLVGQRYGLEKLHQHTHLYTSPEKHPDFIGRTFCIADVMSYADFKRDKVKAAGNVSTRNFPLKAEELRKRHRIGEDGNQQLFFCTGIGDRLLVIFASKC